jgi:hypothetical protein
MSSNPVAFDRDLATGFRAAQGFVSAYLKFRCADDRLSNGENGMIADGRRQQIGITGALAIPYPSSAR